jgi:sporulation protein YlmC with PRC-barrel domain
MKIKMFDSLDEDGARKLAGREVIDESGETVGTVQGFWMDPSTNRVEFVGVKGSWLSSKLHVVPAGDARITEHHIKLAFPGKLIKGAPTASAGAELAQVEKEEINRHYGRSIPLRRVSSIEEIRPEEAIDSRTSKEGSMEDRHNLERSEQAFFNQEGFVTDSMPEVDASQELRRTQKETKARNREDRFKSGSLD